MTACLGMFHSSRVSMVHPFFLQSVTYDYAVLFVLHQVFSHSLFYLQFWSDDASFLSISMFMGDRVPLRRFQFLSCHFHITCLDAFFFLLDIYHNKSLLFLNNLYNDSLAPLQYIIAIVIVQKAHVKFEWAVSNLLNWPTNLLELHKLISKSTILRPIPFHYCFQISDV